MIFECTKQCFLRGADTPLPARMAALFGRLLSVQNRVASWLIPEQLAQMIAVRPAHAQRCAIMQRDRAVAIGKGYNAGNAIEAHNR